jgi:hypothetical protein
MVIQLATNDADINSAPLKTKTQFLKCNPAFTKGGLDWVIFRQKDSLLKERAIAYFGRRILIHEQNFNQYVLAGGTRIIGEILSKRGKDS